MLTESEYRDEIAELANTITQESRNDERDIEECLHEAIDGHEYVIYTANAQAVLAISNNDGAYVETFGSDGLVKNGSLNWSVMAYSAMEADVREHPDFDADEEED